VPSPNHVTLRLLQVEESNFLFRVLPLAFNLTPRFILPSNSSPDNPRRSQEHHSIRLQKSPSYPATMSTPQREAYKLPSQRDGSSQQTNQQPYSAFVAGRAAGDSSSGPVTQYVCGECNSKVQLAQGDVIRCSNCGHRVLYKERTKRYVQMSWRWSR